MASAKITKITNDCNDEIYFKLYRGGSLVYSVTIAASNHETPSEAEDVPEAANASAYADNYGEVTLNGSSTVYTFWQNGDDIYYSQSGTWNNNDLMEFEGTPGTSDIELTVQEADGSPWTVGEVVDI